MVAHERPILKEFSRCLIKPIHRYDSYTTLRFSGLLLPPEHQGSHPTCWAFCVLWCLSASYARRFGQLLALSVQELVDNVHRYYKREPEPGKEENHGNDRLNAFTYINRFGVAFQQDYPYSGPRAGPGRMRFPIKMKTRMTGFTIYKEDVKNLIRAGIPVTCSLRYTSLSFSTLKKGEIWGGPKEGEALDSPHGMLITGFGERNGVEYWEMLNSHGDGFADGGFCFIQQDLDVIGPFFYYPIDPYIVIDGDNIFGPEYPPQIAMVYRDSKNRWIVEGVRWIALKPEYLEVGAASSSCRSSVFTSTHACNSLIRELQVQSGKNAKSLNDQIAVVTRKVLLPHQPSVKLQEIQLFNDHLAVCECKNGLARITVYQLPPVEEPLQGGRAVDFVDPVYKIVLLESQFSSSYSSMRTPPSVYDYDMKTRVSVLQKIETVLGGFESSNYVTERQWATASDGKQIPMSMVYRKIVVKLDGSDPLILIGYGAYETCYDPNFRASRLSLLDRGFVIASAQICGGGDMGRQWYEDGKFLKKKNTFTDFISCAESLIEKKYCSKERLRTNGRSAAGLLIGAILNMRPDLFKVAVAGVPFVDALTRILNPTIPLTTFEWEEWGDPRREEFYFYMKSYFPVDNIKPQNYPAILMTSRLNGTKQLEDQIYAEMHGRIKEDDISAPIRRGPFYYYERALERKEYVQHCRRAASGDGSQLSVYDDMPSGPGAPPEHIIPDENVKAQEHAYYRVTPNNKLVTYAEDTNGDEIDTVHVIDVESRDPIWKPLAGVTYYLEWAGNEALVYITKDEILRQDKVWLHKLGTIQSIDACLYHEKDDMFSLDLGAAGSKKFLFVASASKTTGFVFYLEASKPEDGLVVLPPRVDGIDTSVSHRGNHFFIERRSDECFNSELLACPLDNTSATTILLPHRPSVKIQEIQLFVDHLAVYERENGLLNLTVYCLPPVGEPLQRLQCGRPVDFIDPVYSVDPSESQFSSSILWFTIADEDTPFCLRLRLRLR